MSKAGNSNDDHQIYKLTPEKKENNHQPLPRINRKYYKGLVRKEDEALSSSWLRDRLVDRYIVLGSRNIKGIHVDGRVE